MFAMLGGVMMCVTGFLGVQTALFRKSGCHCIIAFVYILFAFLLAIVLFIMAAVACGANGHVMKAKENACAMDVGDGVTLADKVQKEYNKIVDHNMCSPICACPLEVMNTWSSIP